MPFSQVLGTAPPAGSLYEWKTDLLLLDFFGTWCAPCIRSLPRLAALQEKYRNRIGIMLVSNEEQVRLQKFISGRQPFPLPLLADELNTITGRFAPPAYPYTAVLNRNKEIIALADLASVTDQQVEDWLNGKYAELTSPVQSPPAPIAFVNSSSSNKLVQLSQEFMYAAKTGENTENYMRSLAALSYDSLKLNLGTDPEKKAFWINLYNGFTQVLLQKNPGLYNHRGRFFSAKQIAVAGKSFSLDDIEHGLLRRSKIKWSFGHLHKLCPGKTEKELRVEELDYRLHFALNCGAKSCPPIAFYNPENLNPQLTLATNAYLQQEAGYDAASNRLTLPAIMGWFRRDFGGKRGMIALLKEKKIIPQEARPAIRFKAYDWTLYTGHYKN